MKINILAIAAHPDDVELSCAGTLIAHGNKGLTTGVIDLTRGELGTRGTPEKRLEEAKKAAGIMNLSIRENIGFEDGFFVNDRAHQLALIHKIRKFRPDIVLTNARHDRHPDHGRAAGLVEEACFKSGLRMIETKDGNNEIQGTWRPKKVLFGVQSTSLAPDFFVDISDAQELKMRAIKAYKSQFYEGTGPRTYISSPGYMDMIEARALEYGNRIGVKYAEGFCTNQAIGLKDLYHLI